MEGSILVAGLEIPPKPSTLRYRLQPSYHSKSENDEVEWMEEFDKHDEKELLSEAENLFQEANDFYDREIERYDE